VVDAYCEPKPNPAPPIMVGGPGNKTIALAARYADWYNIADATLERFAERLGVIRQACKAIGRDPKTLRLTWFGRLSLGKTEAEARTRATHVGREHYGIWTIDGAFVGTPAQVVEKIHAFADLGVDYFMFEILDLADPDIRDMAIQEVFAKVNA
jgi:alkanesulfonate monooxygenase SsuD/methylene tetrahydromethanopterin reductase-like flavin-dependent oxidoreductase (luciferase family)